MAGIAWMGWDGMDGMGYDAEGGIRCDMIP